MNVHTEILNQLGGNKFIVMTGSKNFLYSETENNWLSMHLTKNKAKAKFLKIVLGVNDTYTMIFSKVVGRKYEERLEIIKEIPNVYNDQLQKVFTEITGLDTHL